MTRSVAAPVLHRLPLSRVCAACGHRALTHSTSRCLACAVSPWLQSKADPGAQWRHGGAAAAPCHRCHRKQSGRSPSPASGGSLTLPPSALPLPAAHAHTTSSTEKPDANVLFHQGVITKSTPVKIRFCQYKHSVTFYLNADNHNIRIQECSLVPGHF